jgi:AGCS family alanine or glycine:cation symporter
VIFIGSLFSGDVAGVKFIWDIADTANGAMAIPNLIALLLLAKVIFKETREYFPKNTKMDSG